MAGSENEPAISSSDEEEELSSEGSESEPEPDNTPTPPPSSKITQPTSNSQTHNSDSQSMIDNQSRKPRSTGKRPAPDGESSDLKRNKQDLDNGGEKKQLFQRLWSEENEIELIQGMIDYVKEKGKDPVADVNDFHEFVKKSLHIDVNDSQMLTKARRLKKKFENNVAKVENKGKVRSFSNPHEKKMYDLSKTLWGSDGHKNVIMGSNSSTKKVKVKVNVTPKTNKSHKAVGSGSGSGNVGIELVANEVEQKVASGNGSDHLGSMWLPVTDEGIMNKGLELVLGPKKVEMEEKWKNLKMQELEHFLKKVDVLKEQAEVVLNAIVNSGAK